MTPISLKKKIPQVTAAIQGKGPLSLQWDTPLLKEGVAKGGINLIHQNRKNITDVFIILLLSISDYPRMIRDLPFCFC